MSVATSPPLPFNSLLVCMMLDIYSMVLDSMSFTVIQAVLDLHLVHKMKNAC